MSPPPPPGPADRPIRSGTGPYQLVGRHAGQRGEAERFDGYSAQHQLFKTGRGSANCNEGVLRHGDVSHRDGTGCPESRDFAPGELQGVEDVAGEIRRRPEE